MHVDFQRLKFSSLNLSITLAPPPSSDVILRSKIGDTLYNNFKQCVWGTLGIGLREPYIWSKPSSKALAKMGLILACLRTLAQVALAYVMHSTHMRYFILDTCH